MIELDNNPQWVYVGETGKKDLNERLAQHNSGKAEKYAARVFIRGARGRLRPDLYARYTARYTKESALKLEARVAEKLRRQGYKVEGGH